MKTTEEKIAIMQAESEGQIVEVSFIGRPWTEIKSPTWDWSSNDYRIKAKKPREWWANVYGDGTTGCMYHSTSHADHEACEGRVLIHVREVIGED
jgi:hypothetical protein